MDLTLIIVNWNSAGLLAACLASIETWLTGVTYEAVIVDNCSAPEDVDRLRTELQPRFSWARFIYNAQNKGFAAANNQALELAQGKYILLLNPDTCWIQAGFTNLLPLLEQPNTGMVACQLLNTDMSVQESCYYFPRPSQIWVTALLLHKFLPPGLKRKFQYAAADHQCLQRPDWVLGAFMLLSREVMVRLGGFDESIFMYGEDMDICYRLRKLGLEILFVPDLSIIHYGGHSGRQAWSSAKREVMVYQAIFRFYRKHYGWARLALARVIYSLGSVLRMVGYGIGCCKPGNFRRNRHELKTQGLVLLNLMGLK